MKKNTAADPDPTVIILQAPKLKESFQKSVLRITLRLEEIERKKLMLVSFQV